MSNRIFFCHTLSPDIICKLFNSSIIQIPFLCIYTNKYEIDSVYMHIKIVITHHIFIFNIWITYWRARRTALTLQQLCYDTVHVLVPVACTVQYSTGNAVVLYYCTTDNVLRNVMMCMITFKKICASYVLNYCIKMFLNISLVLDHQYTNKTKQNKPTNEK